MPMGLTATQRDALDYITNYIAAHRISPSLAEIGAQFGYKGRGWVSEIMAALKERGYIDYIPHKARSIAVLDPPGSFAIPPAIQAELERFCRATGENPADVVADAVKLHLDECALDAAAA